jgi:hypothetical protein
VAAGCFAGRWSDGRPAIAILGLGEPPGEFTGQLVDIVAQGLVGGAGAATRLIVPCDDARIATAVLAHELLWSITEVLLASGTVDLARSLTAAFANEDTRSICYSSRSNKQPRHEPVVMA